MVSQTIKLTAFLVANQLDIKSIKAFLDIKPAADSSSELFYSFGVGKYQQYFNYGVIVYTGFSEEEMKYGIKAIHAYQKNPVTNWLRDEFQIRVDEARNDTIFEFNEVVTGKVDEKVIRIAMLNLAQSIALDYYQNVAETILAQVKELANQLELTGKLRLSRTNMLKFLGKALNTQNDIAENIYIFDAPDQVWDDEYLDKLYQGLMKHFDLRVRFSELEYTLRIINDNLKVFSDIVHQRESNLLEVIIIVLILVEVFDLLISKLLSYG